MAAAENVGGLPVSRR